MHLEDLHGNETPGQVLIDRDDNSKYAYRPGWWYRCQLGRTKLSNLSVSNITVK